MTRLLLVAMGVAGLLYGQGETRELTVVVGKSLLLDSPANVERVSVADPSLAETVVASPKELILNGKAAGETSLILWQTGGNRVVFDLKVIPKFNRIERIQQELAHQLPGQNVQLSVEGSDVFLRGVANDHTSANRALVLARLLGNPVNMLNVKVPPVEPQILMKVRFADVDRGASSEFSANLMSLGALNTIGSTTTGAFGAPRYNATDASGAAGAANAFTFTDVLNIFLFRPDLNLATTIKALEGKRLLQILAEPNVLAINGKPASFLAGGEFPFPTLQGGGGGLGAVTVQFREFGIRINFTPHLTPRGTLRISITPEVSALDYANGLTFQGFTIPGISTRRVTTEIELENNQSFAIGGLLDNRLTESFSKIPGIGDIPILGKFFRTKVSNRNNSELLVLVTPEIVRPIPQDQKPPELVYPKEFLPGRKDAPRTPPISVTGAVPLSSARETIPYEEVESTEKVSPSTPASAQPLLQFVPMPVPPAGPPAAAGAPPAGKN